jgi:acetolactate synthase-1/3 small subunit
LNVEVISLVVNDEFGVMQRVMGVFTRKRINVDTIVVGKCEIAGKSRIVLTVKDKTQADVAVADLKGLHDIVQAEVVDGTRHEAYALASNSSGKVQSIISNVITFMKGATWHHGRRSGWTASWWITRMRTST